MSPGAVTTTAPCLAAPSISPNSPGGIITPTSVTEATPTRDRLLTEATQHDRDSQPQSLHYPLAPRTVCALDHGPLRGKGPGDSTSSAWWSFIILNPLLLLRPCWLLPRVTGRKRLPYCVQLLVGSLHSADG